MESLNSATILYVDDEPINLELFVITFKKSFKVIVAESGYEGLSILEKNKEINVVISDMKMPNMSGLEFIQKAASIDRSTIFFLLSGYSITDEVNEKINTGLIKKYFQKPFNKEDIISSLKESFKS